MFGGGTGCESGEGSCDLRQVQWTLPHACHYYEAAPPAGAAALSAANFTPRAALFTNKATLRHLLHFGYFYVLPYIVAEIRRDTNFALQ